MRIAVVGAAGYVGRHVVREIVAHGHDVVAVLRSGGSPGLDLAGVTVRTALDAAGAPFHAVVNLAYPRTGPAHGWPAANRTILETVRALAGDEARVVHACTLAVFGDLLEHPVTLGPVPLRRDLPYVEGKLLLQHELLRVLPGRDVRIVRLGNVWGPGSPMWTARLFQLVRDGRPAGIRGHDGYSNVTDVANVSAYVRFLAEGPPLPGPSFHHLAELGGMRWSFWTERIGRTLGLPVVLADPASVAPTTGPAGAGTRTRVLGSVLRSVAGALPPSAVALLRSAARAARPGTPPSTDGSILRLMTCPRLFESHLLPGFVPPVDAEEAWRRVEALPETTA